METNLREKALFEMLRQAEPELRESTATTQRFKSWTKFCIRL